MAFRRHKRAIRKFVLVLRSDLAQLSRLEPFLKKANRELRLDEVLFNQLYLATTEAVTNGIIHGNKQNPRKKVTLTCEVDARSVLIRVHDEGEGHDFTRLANPLAKKNLLKETGRGIFLMRTLMDTVRFRNTTGGTEVIMKLVRRG